jgi:hypothetical protein
MKDWGGNEIKRGQNEENVAPIEGGQTIPEERVQPVRPEREYELPPMQQVDPFPICPDCGRRHPPAGGPEDMGKYLSHQAIILSLVAW